MVKICYAHDITNVYNIRLSKYLIKRGYDFHLLTMQNGKSTTGCKVHRLLPVRPFTISCPLSISFAIKKIQPDILHGPGLNEYGFFCALSGFRPLIVTGWGSDVLLDSKHFLDRSRIVFSLKRADAITVDSNEMRKAVLRLNKNCEKRIFYIPWGVELDVFNPSAKDKSKIREKLGWFDEPIIICTRWHRAIYGVKYLIRAMRFIIKRIPESKLILVGEGPLTKHFKNMVMNMGLGGCVHFAGTVPYNQIPEYLAASNIYVSPSLSDSTSSSLLEAMACGVASAVSNIPANREWIRDGENGLLFCPGSTTDLTMKVIFLLTENQLRSSFSKESLEIVRKRASWYDNAREFERLYQSLAKK